MIQNYQKNHDQKSKEMIILSNTKLVLSLMKRFYQKSNHYEDLFQVGIVGLIKAVDHFDTNYQLQFSTYAVPLIIGEMKRYLRDNTQVKISRPIKDLAYAILKEKEKYLNQYHLAKDEVVVFGNGENDISMLKQTPNSVVVENALDGVKKYTTYLCKNNNEEGVVKLIKEKIL